jgi:uncharacterized membrane protein
LESRAFNDTSVDLKQVINTYNISYVYVGYDELYQYPGCTARFDSISWLKPVYTDQELRIYQVDLEKIGS